MAASWASIVASAAKKPVPPPSVSAVKTPTGSTLSQRKPQLLLMVGVQGSGKTTFSMALCPHGWTRVNQDELGNRRAVEYAVADALNKGQNVVVDRCNFDETQRAHFVKIAHAKGVKDVYCVWLNHVPLEECQKRVKTRTNHPGLNGNENKDTDAIVSKVAADLTAPSTAEGLSQVDEVTDDDAYQTALSKYTMLGKY